MVEQRYPSGRVVKNVLDASGDLSMVQSARCMDAAAGTDADCAAQAGLWNYAKNFTYNAAGAVTSMQLGNGRFTSVDPPPGFRFSSFLLSWFEKSHGQNVTVFDGSGCGSGGDPRLPTWAA